jgi:hypothetical protein
MRASGAAMRSDAKNAGSAAGIWTFRSVSNGVAPYARHRSIDSGRAERKPMLTFTSVGKNVTIPEISVTASRPRPNTNAINGVIATRGTDCSTMAIGMTVCSTPRRRLKAIASITAAIDPAASPRKASTRVWPEASSSTSRLAAASGSLTTCRHTSSGPRPTNGSTSNTTRNNCQSTRITAIATTVVARKPRRRRPRPADGGFTPEPFGAPRGWRTGRRGR